MKALLLIALAALVIPVALACAPPSTNAANQPTGISVSGEGSMLVRPDLAQVTLGVQISAPLTSNAWQQVAEKMQAVVSKLKELGITDKDFQTVQVSANMEERSGAPPALLVVNLVRVKVRNLSQLGSILDVAVAAGANRIDSLFFTIDDPEALLQQARDKAMADAKAKAEQLARAAGVKLGKAIRIEESGVVPIPKGAFGLGGGADTSVSPGETEIRASVNITYAID